MNANANSMLREGQEALVVNRKQVRKNRVAVFTATMDLIMKSLSESGSDLITFLGMCEPEWEVRPTKINIVWQIEPWFKVFASRAIAAGNPAEAFTIVGYLGVSGAEPVFNIQSTFKREQIVMTIARYLEECSGMETEE